MPMKSYGCGKKFRPASNCETSGKALYCLTLRLKQGIKDVRARSEEKLREEIARTL